ncbi:hypothetical protein HNQ57_002838 [Zhongshania antarctica]|uniref:ArsR family transcriptional regulator n=1 Tax=Zhongshania antarctica TaxID=641702 RepID=A0A840R7P9_9GAMM|nr:hypothetical protein [Zhongshania antarctica]MBB5188548.1 hypothetical protein [Zhongshania antarctica]
MTTRQDIRTLIPPSRPRKIARVLNYLACGNSINSIEAETLLNEHSLPSTISTLKKKYRFEIIRVDDQENERFMRYSLDTSPDTTQQAFTQLIEWGYRDPQLQLFAGKDTHE